jgi:CRP-like cAMP-binding protein
VVARGQCVDREALIGAARSRRVTRIRDGARGEIPVLISSMAARMVDGMRYDARHADGADRLAFLRSVPLFRRLRPEELAFLSQQARGARVPRGTVLFRQAATAGGLFAVCRGGVKLVQQPARGAPYVVRMVGPRGMVGIDALAHQPMYSVSAITLSWSETLAWSRDVMRDVMDANPHLAVGAMQLLSSRIDDLRMRYHEITSERVETRLARAIFRAYCDWTAEGGASADAERRDGVELPLARQDLADLAGMTLCTVSRLVQAWERSGILRAGRLRLTLLHPMALPLGSRNGAATAPADPPVAEGYGAPSA